MRMITTSEGSDLPIRSPSGPAVVLVSGGIDSGVLAGRMVRAGRPIFPLYIRQGTLWEDAEVAALGRFLAALAAGGCGGGHGDLIRPLTVLRVDLPPHYVSRWAWDRETGAPDAESPDSAVDLPGRNLALLIQGALLAQSLDVREVQIGLLRGNPFPDARREFREDFARLFAAATGFALAIEAPLGALTKAEVIGEGVGLPLEHTLSCLRPAGGRHCGRCNKCAERRRGFAAAGIIDKAAYANNTL